MVKVQITVISTEGYFCRQILHHYYLSAHKLDYVDNVTSTPQCHKVLWRSENLGGHMCGGSEMVHD